MLGNLLIGFLIIVVGVNLAPIVASTVAGAVYIGGNTSNPNPNMSGAAGTVLNLTTLFYNLAIAVAAMDIAVVGLRQSGLMM
jgi:hypothetical protein